MKRADKKQIAYDLFMNTDKSQQEICEIVNCTAKTLSNWKTKDKWQELKSAQTLTASKIIRQLYMKLDELSQTQGALDADKIIKIANSIEKLSDRNATMSQAINVFKDFTSWLVGINPELAKQVNEAQRTYITHKING
jgi:hypothetical protein